MDSMAASMVTACLRDWSEARNGAGESDEGQEVWAMGFASTGESLGRVEAEDYRSGCRKSGTTYLARLENEPVEEGGSARKIRVSVEFPAAAPAEKRQRLEFFTRLP